MAKKNFCISDSVQGPGQIWRWAGYGPRAIGTFSVKHWQIFCIKNNHKNYLKTILHFPESVIFTHVMFILLLQHLKIIYLCLQYFNFSIFAYLSKLIKHILQLEGNM